LTVSSVAPRPETGTESETESANRAAVRRLYEEALNGGRLEVVDELAGPGFVSHSAQGAAAPGAESIKATARMTLARFPDRRYELQDVLAEGDRVAVRWTMRGTNTGDHPGAPPATGRPVAAAGYAFYRLEGGRLLEQWAAIDRLDVLQQLGQA
jgi:predicted ester cyclase